MRSTPLILALTTLAALPGFAAPKSKPVAKPAAKPAVAAPKNRPIVLGTKQLPGDFGEIGTTYTIGKESPINFTLVSAEYRPDRFCIGDTVRYPQLAEKLLVVRFTVQNPQPQEIPFDHGRLDFTAVDSKGENHEPADAFTVGSTGNLLETTLKPAQKVEASVAFIVPAAGVVPKLIVLREDGAAVIRYDLRGKATPLAAPYADSKDATGATLREEVPVALGTYSPHGEFDATVDSVNYISGKVGDYEPEEGKRVLVVNLTVKNASLSEHPLHSGTFAVTVLDAEGERNDSYGYGLKATRNEEVEVMLRAGQESKVRFLVPIPEKVPGKTVLLTGDGNRPYAYDISGVR